MAFCEAAMAMQHQAKRRSGARGSGPLSAQTRKRLLAALLTQAEAGDVAASEALVRLSFLRGDTATARRALAEAAPA